MPPVALAGVVIPLVLIALVTLSAATHTARADPVDTSAPAPAIVVDHTSTDLEQIPTEWIERAKELTLHYAHTSHGSQIVSGIQALERADDRYDVAVRQHNEVGLPDEPDALRIYDGNAGDTYITPELYWSSDEGLRRTRSVADTQLFGLSMWSWCGQQSSNSEPTVRQYLDTLARLETDYPGMRFIYMTGHTDGGGATLARNNQMVRDFVRDQGKVLFDFADIESYDPDGNHYPNTSDACAWCADWCAAHPADCADAPGSCAHSHPFNCKLKGRAFWWLMARLAGWPGPGGSDPATPDLPTSEPSTPGSPTPDRPTPERPTPESPTPDRPTPGQPTAEQPTPGQPAHSLFLPLLVGAGLTTSG